MRYIVIFFFQISISGKYWLNISCKLPESKGVSHYNLLENDFLTRLSGNTYSGIPLLNANTNK